MKILWLMKLRSVLSTKGYKDHKRNNIHCHWIVVISLYEVCKPFTVCFLLVSDYVLFNVRAFYFSPEVLHRGTDFFWCLNFIILFTGKEKLGIHHECNLVTEDGCEIESDNGVLCCHREEVKKLCFKTLRTDVRPLCHQANQQMLLLWRFVLTRGPWFTESPNWSHSWKHKFSHAKHPRTQPSWSLNVLFLAFLSPNYWWHHPQHWGR